MTADGQSEAGAQTSRARRSRKPTETIAAAGCEEPRADAEALVAYALGVDVEELSARRLRAS